MQLSTTLLFLVLGVFVGADSELRELTDEYLKKLTEESLLDFKLFLIHHDYYDDGSIKHTDTVVFSSNLNKSSEFKLASLGDKKISEFVKKSKENGVSVAVAHEDLVKNSTNNYKTERADDIDSPASRVIANAGGYELGITEEIFDTLFQTTNVANIEAYQFHPNKQIKKKTVLEIQAEEVVVKDKNMNPKMVEQSKKLLKKAFKIDVSNRAAYIAHQFDETYPNYKWQILTNPIDYAYKSNVMVSLKFHNNVYTILGNKRN
ncbi:hypothetical protein FQA39_LY16980 [Lamprigera yunnana]|nr:hypothetical protein FQA39_LY16980 [Lamprigera yunnana]